MKLKKQIKKLLRRVTNPREEVYVVSYPKSGRTWLRIMVGEYVKRKYQLDEQNVIDTHHLMTAVPGLPRVQFSHGEGGTLWKRPEDLEQDKTRYQGARVILLVRDPRDIIVSAYFQKAKRHKLVDPERRERLNKPVYEGTIKEYVYGEEGSIDTLIAYYNSWWASRELLAEFCILRYEDMREHPLEEFRKVLQFIGIATPDEALMQEVVEFTSFENLKKLERDNHYESIKLAPADKNDPESFKVRRGKVGGYVDYLGQEEIDYLNQKIKAQLSPEIGYH